MSHPRIPEHVARITPGDPFSFSCHPGIGCFTECCRNLDLALTPYDVLRLRYATGLSSTELHDRYIIREQEEEDAFPHFYLTMIDDGSGSCAFVTEEGCRVYDHRPGACRTYPLGRAVVKDKDGLQEFFVLIREPHCLGFSEKTIQTVQSFSQSQELGSYNRFNDLIIEIQQHEKIRNGMKLDRTQIDCYTTALYDLDAFRKKLIDGSLATDHPNYTPAAIEDDELLLEFAVAWLKTTLFS